MSFPKINVFLSHLDALLPWLSKNLRICLALLLCRTQIWRRACQKWRLWYTGTTLVIGFFYFFTCKKAYGAVHDLENTFEKWDSLHKHTQTLKKCPLQWIYKAKFQEMKIFNNERRKTLDTVVDKINTTNWVLRTLAAIAHLQTNTWTCMD